MGKFAKASKQAASVMKELQGGVLQSVGTVRNYEQALTRVAEYAKAERINGGLRGLTPDQALTYLEIRGQEVGQSTLNMERQAIQAMMQHVTSKLKTNIRLTVIKSELVQATKSRAYTTEQIRLIANAQTDKNQLATNLAYAAGLRAHELLTLRPVNERAATPGRPANETKFNGREGQLYTVHGKGGLVREVLIPHDLAEQLERTRLPEPRTVDDRGVIYEQHYNINGGQKWSASFSAASNRALFRSNGAHGLRHSYAQQRMHELQSQGLKRDLALETVSQELGHFRPQITEVYLR